MAKKKRKSPDPWTCPKCGRTFGTKGRHLSACKGKDKLVTDGSLDVPTVRRGKGRRGGTVTPGALASMANLNGYRTQVEAFQQASQDMVTMFLGVIGEAEIYKRERDELLQFKQGLTALLGRGTQVAVASQPS